MPARPAAELKAASASADTCRETFCRRRTSLWRPVTLSLNRLIGQSWSVRISNLAIALQFGLFIGWARALWGAPRTQNWREPHGATCPVLTGIDGDVVLAFLIASVPVGVVALVASVVSIVLRTSQLRALRLFVALLAAALVFPMAFVTLISAFCGSG